MVKKLKGKISNIVDLSSTVKEFTIDLPENLNFKAGQFINISIEHEGETLRKPYSIASSPTIQKQIKLCIKLIPDGDFTPILWEKDIGFEVEIMGPLGLFGCNPKKDKVIFIGAGTGISPLKSMILNILESNKEKEVQLIFGIRKEDEILYHQEFLELEKNNPNFKYLPIISKPTDSWTGRTNHVQDNFDLIDPMNSEIYLCGLKPMIEESTNKLLSMGISQKDINTEKY